MQLRRRAFTVTVALPSRRRDPAERLHVSEMVDKLAEGVDLESLSVEALLLPPASFGSGAHRGRNTARKPTRLFLIDG